MLDLLKPHLGNNGKKEEDMIFDVNSLASYLNVSKQWIYERTHLNAIPFIKKKGLLRFRKKDIDKWLESDKMPSIN